MKVFPNAADATVPAGSFNGAENFGESFDMAKTTPLQSQTFLGG
jgi:hypothetical protein